MAYSSLVIYPTLNGSVRTFAVPFPYLDKEHVKFYRLAPGAEVAEGPGAAIPGTDFAWTTPGAVTFVSGPVGVLLIQRETPREQLAVKFTGGTIGATALNTATTQLLYLAQEAADQQQLNSGRAVRVPFGETIAPSPSVGARSGLLAAWSSTGRLVTAAYQSLATALAPFIATALGPLYKGDPGGNAMAIGLFVSAAALSIPLGTDLVQTSGHHLKGIGTALYSAVDADPGLPGAGAFQSANGRWFRIVLVHGAVSMDAFGAVPDAATLPGAPNVAVSGTDALQPFYDATLASSHVYSPNYIAGPTILCDGDYRFSGPVALKAIVRVFGTSSGVQNLLQQTRWYFPQNVPGVTVNTFNTLQGAVVPNGRTATGSSFEGITLISAGGTDRTAHGWWIQNTVRMVNCMSQGFPGDGFAIIANSDGSIVDGKSSRGNANSSYFEKCIARETGRHGFHVNGADANACTFVACQAVAHIGGCALKDHNTLGNNYFGSN